MSSLLYYVSFVIVTLLVISCQTESNFEITYCDNKVVFKSNGIVPNSRYNMISDSPDTEHFLVDTMNNYDIILTCDYRSDILKDFNSFQSILHEYCNESCRVTPSNYYILDRKVDYDDEIIFEFSQYKVQKDSTVKVSYVATRSVLNKSISIGITKTVSKDFTISEMFDWRKVAQQYVLLANY